MNYTIAHFSDLHLGPLPRGAAFRHFRAKRLLGAMSWHFRRRHVHLPQVADALVADIKAAMPDHVAFTGDAANLASPLEFPLLRAWMDGFGPPDWISYVPGNHDAYVKVKHEKALACFAPFMAGDMRVAEPFPYVRLRKNIALIGLNSAVPRGFLSAEGRLGRTQLSALPSLLDELRIKGFYRLVMIHHPPGLGIAGPLRGLIDASRLTEILCSAGVELVIHGHNHIRELNWLEADGARVPAIGVPSASMATPHPQTAEWNLYSIARVNGHWQTNVSIRKWRGENSTFNADAAFELSA